VRPFLRFCEAAVLCGAVILGREPDFIWLSRRQPALSFEHSETNHQQY
jgi:hypothetical protein